MSLQKIISDRVQVTRGGAATPFTASVQMKWPHDLHPVSAQEAGTTILAYLVQGLRPEFLIDVKTADHADVKEYLGLDGTQDVQPILAVGDTLPGDVWQFHDVDADDTKGDWVLHNGVVTNLERTVDGQGEAIQRLTLNGTPDGSGDTLTIGVAP